MANAAMAQITLSVPSSMEILANGLRSLAFVARLEGVSPEVAASYSLSIDGMPLENPPVFDNGNGLFYWRPEPGQVGKHSFKFKVSGPIQAPITKNVTVNVKKAPSLEALPRGWADKNKVDRYLQGKRYLPSTNIIDLDIAARPNYEITVQVKAANGEDCFLHYLPEAGNTESYKLKNTAIIKIGAEYAGRGVKRIRRDLYEDLYNYLEMIFKNIESIEITGEYFLKNFTIYDDNSYAVAIGAADIELPQLNLSFDDRFYMMPMFSKDSPILISETPTIKVDFNTRSGLRWRRARLKIDKKEYHAAKGQFTLIVVKPYKNITPFEVDYALYMLRIPSQSELPFGEHHFVFEVENAYGNVITREAFARVVSVPAEIVGRPLVYPNPFSPARQGEAKIQYELTVQTGIELAIFAVDGSVVTRRRFTMGEEGGKKGMNTVSWSGRSDAGMTLPNGIYSAVLIDREENRILDKFLITIYQ
jgi:hypothetical protein